MTETQRKAVQQALELICGAKRCEINSMSSRQEMLRLMTKAVDTLRAALAEPIPHGCYVDPEDGVEPEGCVFDEGRPERCLYARRLHREGKGKESCQYWRPIEVKK